MGLICCACCFGTALTKTLEIILIIFHSIGSSLLLLSLIIIKWSKISNANLAIFIIMFLISIANLIIIILLRLWRAKNLIKTSHKKTGLILSTIAFILTIILLILNIVEEYLLTIGFRKTNYPCYYNSRKETTNNYYYNHYLKQNENTNKRKLDDKDIDCLNLGDNYNTGIITYSQYLISYSTFTFLEASLILGMFVWYILRSRIIQGLDGPNLPNMPNLPNILPMQRGLYDQYGRQVVVIQPGDVVYMDGQRNVAISAENQYNYQSNNPQYNNPQYISNQINNQIPDSNEYNLQEKAH